MNENTFGRKGNYFDGTDDYVLHDAHAVARVAANDTVGTYTAWIYIDDIGSGGFNTILSAGDNDSANEFLSFHTNGAELNVSLVHGGATQFAISQTIGSLESKKWTHVALVQNGTQPALYINGKNAAVTNDTATDLTFWYDELTLIDKFAIGVRESNATHTNDFKGAIGRVKYFALDLNASEILKDCQGVAQTTRATEIETARVFDISMENDGTTDSGSGADDGTLTGNAHYGGYISDWSYALEPHVTGHAAETMNTIDKGNGNYETIIKRGD